MKKRIWAVMFTVIMLTTGCTIRMESSTEENRPSSVIEMPSSSAPEDEPESSSPSSEVETSNSSESNSSSFRENNQEDPNIYSSSDSAESNSTDAVLNSNDEPVNSLAGYSEKDFGTFSLYLPTKSVVKSDVIYEDSSELARKIAEVTSVDSITDAESPFLIYDQTYSNAESVSECNFGNYSAKSYFIQKEVSEGGMTGFQNSIVYCIELDSKMIVITFYPMRGVGISEQREEFENILDSIQI